MLAEHKLVIDDLLNYLVDGIHLDTTGDNFNGVSYNSVHINNIKYQFIRRQEHVNSIIDNKIIPVLVITQPEQYLKGKIIYNGKFVDMRTLLVKGEDGDGRPIKKINFFVIPQLLSVSGSTLGRIGYDLKLDYISDFDPYGFMSKEISDILMYHYYRSNCGEYHYLPSPVKGNLFFVPTNQRFINQQSLLNRIAQSFDIRFCAVV